MDDSWGGDNLDDEPVSLAPVMLDTEDSPEKVVLQIFRNGLVMAAETIVATSRGGIVIQERMPDGQIKEFRRVPGRLEYDAAKYVVEYVLGKPNTQQVEGEDFEEAVEKWRKAIIGVDEGETEDASD